MLTFREKNILRQLVEKNIKSIEKLINHYKYFNKYPERVELLLQVLQERKELLVKLD